ncbi:MAG: phosphoribosylaminoimidazolesuccinocarboxamide synthase [Candidatus Kariarchaeaceae archaeon]
MELLYEGKAKKIYLTEKEDEVILEYKDSLTAGNGAKKGEFTGKGIINAQVTALIFDYLSLNGIDTHLIELLTEDTIKCTKVEIIPLEIVVRNIVAGSFSRRYDIEEGKELKEPLVELFLKEDKLNDPLITDDAAIILELITEFELSYLKTITLQINTLLKELFSQMNLNLVDYKLEYGRTKDGKILLADEITQDTVRVWDKDTGEKKDKDRFRRDLGNVKETYETFLEELKAIRKREVSVETITNLRIEQKEGIMDPVGEITKKSLTRLGYVYVEEVEVGKTMSLRTKGTLNDQFYEDLKKMNSKLLSNPLVEKTTFRFSNK